MPLILVLKRQRQVDLCNSETSLVYRGSSQDSQGYMRDPVSKQKHTNRKPFKRKKKSKLVFEKAYGSLDVTQWWSVRLARTSVQSLALY